MTKNRAIPAGQQPFQFAAEPPPAEILAELKHALTRAIKRRGSRAELAEHLSRLTGENITEAMINNWTSESKPDRYPPPHLLAPVCAWCGDWKPMRILLAPHHQHLIDEKHKTLMEYGELYIQEHALKAKKEMVHDRVHRAFFGGADR